MQLEYGKNAGVGRDDDYIVHSLLENDLYKFSMWQALMHSHPGARAEYSFTCRNEPLYPLAELADEAGEPRVEDLAVCRGIEDRTVRDIGAALMPLFDMADDVRDRLLVHVALAFNAHIAQRYGRPRYQH